MTFSTVQEEIGLLTHPFRASKIPDFHWIDEYPIQEREWLIEDLISPYINILSGQPKVGKSTLATAIALAVTNKQPVLGKQVIKQGPIAWMGYDSGWDEELCTRTTGREDRKILVQPPFDLTKTDLAHELGANLRRVDCKLLVIDHLYGFATGNNLDINNQLDASTATRGVQIINTEYQIPVLLVAHAPKGRSGGVAHSNLLKGLARVLLEMTGTSGNGRRTVKVIGNQIETHSLVFYISETDLVTLAPSTEQGHKRSRDFESKKEKARKAFEQATPQDLTSASSFGRLFFRLRHSKSESGGIKMVQRYIELGILIEKNGEIQPGPNLDT
jgi:RecA-family ATPase